MRRARRIGIWAGGVLLALAVALAGAVFIGVDTDFGHRQIERLTHALSAGRVQLTGLGGTLSTQLTLAELQLYDERGVWLTARDLSAEVSPRALLEWRVQVDSLRAASVRMERLPVFAPSKGHVSIPRIDADIVSIAALKLAPELAGTAATLSVDGGAHLRSVERMAFDVVARRLDGDGNYDMHLRFDAARMDATLQLHEPASGPLENLVRLPGLGALVLNASLAGPRNAERVELALTAGGLRGSAKGQFDLTHAAADVEFALDAPATQPRPEFSWRRLALRGRWHGPLTTPTADGLLQVENLQLPGGVDVAALNATLSAAAGMLTVRAVAGGLEIPGPERRLFAQDPVTVDATLRLNDAARPLEFSATHRLAMLHGRATTAGPLGATLELRLPEVAPFAALAGQDARGDAIINAAINGTAPTHFSLDANAGLRGGTAAWLAALGDRAALQLAGELTETAVKIDRLQVSGRDLSASLSGSASRPATGAVGTIDGLTADWQVDVMDLAALSSVLAGRLSAAGHLSGPPRALTGDARLTATVSVRGSTSGTVSAAMQARGLPGAPSGTLNVGGTFDGAPLNIDVALERGAGESWQLLVHKADWKSAHADGRLAAGATLAESQGQIHLQLGRLEDARDLLGMNMQGSVAGNLGAATAAGRTQLRFQIDGSDLVAGSFAGSARVTGAGPLDALALELTAQAHDALGAAASLGSDARLNLPAGELRVAAATLDYRGAALRLLAPAVVSFAGGLTVDQLRLGAADAEFDLGGRVLPALDLRASLHRLNYSLVDLFQPDLLSGGTLEGEAQLQGTLAAPVGHVEATATGIRFSGDEALALPAVDLHAAADLTGEGARLDTRIAAGKGSLLTAAGRVPLDAAGAFDLKVAGKLDVGLFSPLLEVHGQHVAGALSVDATVTGTAAAPEIDGTIRLADGNLRDFVRGVNLTGINARIVGNNGKLEIQSFDAAAGSGTLAMTGTIGVLQPGVPVDLKLTAKHAQPIANDLITVDLDADLRLQGTARARIDAAGTMHLNRTVIGIPNGLPPDVAVLDVRRRGQKAPPPAARRLVIGLDVAVDAPQQIFVRGRGLDAELGGNLHVAGTTETPIVTGSFDLRRGVFSLASSELTFTAGRVSFDSAGLTNRIDPTLNFTAETTVTDATVKLTVSGLADSPKFEFTSSPPLQPDEIMARLLFGVSAAQLSALQVASISYALANLSGVGGNSLNPLVKLQKSLGLDRLTVGSNNTGATTTAANTGATIAAGRHISKRVYVEARQTTTGTSQVQVDVDLTKHLKLQTRIGNGTAIVQGTTPENDPGSSVGLSYQFEY